MKGTQRTQMVQADRVMRRAQTEELGRAPSPPHSTLGRVLWVHGSNSKSSPQKLKLFSTGTQQ